TGIRRIDDLRGLGGKMPLTMAAFTLAAVSKVGIPPTAGFVSKFYLSLGALEAGEWIFVIVILLASLMTAVFYLRVINLIFFGGDKHEGKVQRDELPLSMLVPIIILALGCAVFGIFVGIPLRLVEPAVMVLSGM
ncbi:oxidoreductase, partial [Dehalococcoidia bacterium]|nr:oxidoreductase [Dehalococcoidia bacterium]